MAMMLRTMTGAAESMLRAGQRAWACGVLCGKRLAVIWLLLLAVGSPLRAQYNTDRLMLSGEIALHYEDYVLSIQYFNQVIVLKPYLYRPWQYRGIAKFCLEDFSGAVHDVSQAIRLNP